jgi:hypothetical protein
MTTRAKESTSETPQTKPAQAPAIGRIVHFVHGSRHVPAIIVDPEQNDGERTTQCLFVMTLEHGAYTTFADFDPTGKEHATWHWPEFVPPVEKG